MFFEDKRILANMIGVKYSRLTHIVYFKGVDKCYTTFSVVKKNNSLRQISAPQADLKDIQRRIAELLYKKKEMITGAKDSETLSHGFEKGKNIITNARVHRNKKYVLNIDIQDFFDSFHFGRVLGYFSKNKNFDLEKNDAVFFAQILCYKGSLPQGAPTSPIVANLISQILDNRVVQLSKKYRLDYTRYADDLTFSTNNKYFYQEYNVFLEELTKIINKCGFKINQQKTRLQFHSSRQKVTGLTVNKKISVDKEYVRKTRAMAYSLYSKGNFVIDGKLGTLNQLEGRFSYINSLDKYENNLEINNESQISKCKRNFRTLNSREKQYQLFLFYKFFYNNQFPLVITEGKTDEIYLIAALRKHHQKYPLLIAKDADGKFHLKFRFLKRRKRLHYFFDISKDGADTLSNIYNHYFGHKNKSKGFSSNYYYFSKFGQPPRNPVIILFDNEIEMSKSPIQKFHGYIAMSTGDQVEFKDKMVHRFFDSNLYLLTHPLNESLISGEIEDLFDTKLLSIEIEGRTFNRNVEKGDSKNYGKKDFADYIMANYQNISFDNFLPLLDLINGTIQSHK